MSSTFTLSRRLLVALAAVLMLSTSARAERTTGDTGEPVAAAAATAGSVRVADCDTGSARIFLDINNATGPLYNIGALFWRSSGDFLYEIPAGSGLHSIFATGLWAGGLYNGVATDLRFAGSTYGPWEYWPGPLGADGDITQAECATFDQFWKVNKQDIINYSNGAEVENLDDLRTWPIAQGAPFYVDANGNNQRDPDTEPLIEYDITDAEYSPTLGAGRQINLDAGERPDIIGDQGIWWVMNDVGNVHGWSGASPIGLEVRVLAFGFNTADALNNTTFYKYQLFYRNNAPLQNTYIGYFSDPDLGDYQDDYVGSDIDLGLGFVYNGDTFDAPNAGGYGSLPPALGYDYFQGPLVNADGIDNDGDGVTDEEDERLQVDTFFYFTNASGPTSDPSSADDRARVSYQYMQGIWKDGVPMTRGGDGYNPGSTEITRFAFPGDPPGFWSEYNVDGLGTSTTPSDRRFGVASGPFTLNPNDKQEIVFGILWSTAPDACASTATPQIASLQQLKFDDITVQGAFNAQFVLPSPPSALELTATPLDQEVILDFEPIQGTLFDLINYEVESPFAEAGAPDNTYNFEGIRIIQYRNEQDQTGTVIATYDLNNSVTTVVDSRLDCSTGAIVTGVVAQGTNSGTENTIPTSISITTDAFRSGNALINNQTYYFGVQPYAYNEFSSPQRVFSAPLTRVAVRPTNISSRNDGTVLNAGTNDALMSTPSATTRGEGTISAVITNPAALTGDDYQVQFFTQLDANGNPAVDGSGAPFAPNYRIVNATTGTVILDGNAYFQRYGTVLPQTTQVAQADGLTFSVEGPANGFSNFLLVANSGGAVTPATGAGADYNGFPAPAGWRGSAGIQQLLDGNTNAAPVFGTDAIWFFATGGRATYQEFLDRALRNDNADRVFPRDFEARFTAEGSTSYQRFGDDSLVPIPFEIWDIGIATPNDPSDDVRMIPALLDIDGDGTYNLSSADSPISGGADDPETDWVYWYYPNDMTPGRSGYDAWLANAATAPADHGAEVLARTTFAGWNLGAAPPYSLPYPEQGSVFRLVTFKPNQPGDSYTISTAEVAASRGDATTAESALDLIAVTPNPYRGESGYEQSGNDNVVRFVNLPANATIRIFTLSGTLIRTLNKANDGNTTLDWDLKTQAQLPAASGIYLIHIEGRRADGSVIGERILKFGMVQRRVQLDFI